MAQVITLVLTASITSTNTLPVSLSPSGTVPVASIQQGAIITGTGIPAGTYLVSATTSTIVINNVVTLPSGRVLTVTSNAGSVKRYSSDHKIKVPSGGQITLDTGTNSGLVFITGNLNVQGDVTYLHTTNLNIEDNIITLNKGETGVGVSEIVSGIEIDRGTATSGNARLVWDENESWTNPATNLTEYGLFTFKTINGGLNGIQTNAIDTNGNDLYLINNGVGIISVTGTTDYEEQVLDYTNSLSVIEDDIIPNIKAVADKITYEIFNSPGNKIKRQDTQVVIYDNDISDIVETFDTLGSPSTSVKVNTGLILNSENNIAFGRFVTITGSGITNLDGTWMVNSANSSDTFFYITTISPVTASLSANIATIKVENSLSNVKVIIDGGIVADFQSSRVDVYGIRISNSTISSTISNTDLVLDSPGSGSVQINDNLKLPYITPDPSSDANNVKIFAKAPDVGQSGIYFVNTQYNDELISKRKALAFSILF
jgi:hypothetical protein